MKTICTSAAAVVACAAALGCARKDNLYEDRDWTQETGSRAAWREVESLFGAEESDADRHNYTLRGVRHDLTLVKDAHIDAHCTCLDVAIGPADDARFRWAAEVPIISPEQVSVVVRTEGSNCVLPNARRRPSIYAVDQTNGNTVVVIEELPSDRPQALGAIVQLPQYHQALYVRSRRYKDQVLPYALGTAATAWMCRVMRRMPPVPKND